MIERTGNLFDTEARILGHGVNVDGLMGAGIAKAFRNEFPVMYRVYQRRCEDGDLQPGGFMPFYDGATDRLVVNFASQDRPGANASYVWLFQSVLAFVKHLCEGDRIERYGNRIALPEIGCGIGGLEWFRVKHLLEKIEEIYPDVEFEVWHYAG